MRIALLLLLPLSLVATVKTVKSGGGGDFTTIQACATAMTAGDTCTVFAGTYAENVTVTAGTVGNYKTLNVNGSDVVTVQSFTLGSHNKLVGNCTAPAATDSCGFNIQNTSSPSSSACVGFSGGATDIYVTNNVMYACGSGAMVKSATTATFVYVQGNTLRYACITIAQAGTATKECNGILFLGDHFLIEGNDMSHYTLGIDQNASQMVVRNNTFHDQFETEAGGNAHTDYWFSEPGNATNPAQYNLIENNLQYNAVGANAKGILAQDDSSGTCGTACTNLIERFNVTSRTGSSFNSNNGGFGWDKIKIYNNTSVDLGYDSGNLQFGDVDNSETTPNGSFLNQLYYFTNPTSLTSFNIYGCGSNCNAGYSLYWCTNSCTTVHGHTYGVGTWLGDTGNKNADPKFVNYISAGNASNDYRLQAGSPALNAGTNLTTVAAGDSGSGTSLVVTDASYFQDGLGLGGVGVQGDCISVTTVSNHVCITAVNYSTNTITLSGSFSRSNADSVWLYSDSSGTVQLVGSAPNIGAKMQAPIGGGSFSTGAISGNLMGR